MEQEYPFQGQYTTIGGHRLHYLDEGSGEPVVMLHGNPSWSFYYRKLVLQLRDRYRCIVPDHIGMGLSDKPADKDYSYRLAQRVDDLEQLLDRLVPAGKVTLVLHDWGGMIGMTWAHRHPERLARLVVLNTAAFPLPPTKPLPPTLRLCRDSWLGALLVRGFNAFAFWAAQIGCTRNPMPQAIRRLYCRPYDSWRNRIATLRFVQDIPLSPTDPGFELVKAVEAGLPRFLGLPLLILWGACDFVFDRHFLARWQELFPAAEVHCYDDCGHYVLEDAASEALPLIDDFLRRHPLEQGT